MKSKENVLDVFYGSLEIYTRYSWDADEAQKKKVLGVYYNSFLRGSLLFKGAICKKV